ncbi:biliverdin-producing heme oxygenase [Luteolibacter marinus]|uniref:biliverdin-producing heme oxygenase n=1 Tax=Luteolibacter marinus TaxID=2776705 RepID=UPI001866B643|nr:biliverdin-producing heme oxygenase [Luteolibacter marinus]
MSFISRLRSATGELHRQLDASPWAEEAVRSRRGYAGYLERFHRGLAGCWPEVDWHQAAELGLPDLEMRQGRYRALESDLAALGRRIDRMPARTSAGAAAPGTTVGCLYVLEGSVHGGRQLLGLLESNTGPVAEAESAFFRGFGERTASSWREFLAWLELMDPPAGFHEAAEDSARRSFGHFIAAFGGGATDLQTPTYS